MAQMVREALVPLVDRLEEAKVGWVALHIGGTVVDHLERECQELLPRLQALVADERLELVASPFYGAPISAIPEPDAVAQLQLDVDWIRSRIDARVRGAWLPTEGWDPVIPRVLSRASLNFTFLDLRLLPWTEPGWVTAERDGHTVGIIPVDQVLCDAVSAGVQDDLRMLLRQRQKTGVGLVCAAVPLFRPAHQGTPLGWLGPVLDLMRDEVAWLRPVLPSTALASGPGGHRASPMAGLRPEIGAECLVPGTADQPLGIPWSRFLVRSDDANRLHKRMLRVSREVQRMRVAARNARHQHLADRQVQEASLDLYLGQGAALFMPSPRGELERSEVRHAAWASLARAEVRARGELGQVPSPHTKDMDGDGVQEVYISTAALDAVICPAKGGALVELNLPGVGNILNTLQRQRPPWVDTVDYEARLPQLVGGPQLVAIEADEIELEDTSGVFLRTVPGAGLTGLPERDESTSERARDVIAIPPELEELLVDDRWARLGFQERFPGPELRAANIARSQAPELGDFVAGRYQLVRADRDEDGEQVMVLTRDGQVETQDGHRMVRITKRYVFSPDSPGFGVHYEVINRYSDPIDSRFAVELNLNLDGSRGAGRGLWVQVRDPEVPGGVRIRSVALDAEETIENVVELGWCLDDHGHRVWVSTPVPARLYVVPIDSVVWSSRGFERAPQGHCLLFMWELELWGDERKRFELNLRVESGTGPQ
jgi:hypothetical protein